jgi:hypothetical protein
MRRSARFPLCAMLAAAAGALVIGQERRPRESPIGTLIADARAVPAEFSADTLIRLAGFAQISTRTKTELLDEAFQRAQRASDSYRLSARPELPDDSRQGAQRQAYATGLNRVSLQSRAAQQLAFIDPPHGRERFEWIDLNVSASSCDTPLVPAVDDYYTALGYVARTTFGSDRGAALWFLEFHLWRAHLPSEMPAVGRAMQRFQPKAEEATYLENVLRVILQGSRPDARGFSTASLDIVQRLADLQKAHKEMGVSGWDVMVSLRDYLTTQLKGPRCADSITEAMTAPAFNAALTVFDADYAVKPIDGASLRPSRMLGPARIDYYWQSPEARRLREEWIQLRGQDRTPVALSIRVTSDWRDQAEHLLTGIEQWTGIREPAPGDYLYQKSVLLTSLLELMPQSPVRVKALRALIEFLRHEDNDRNLRSLWFAMLSRLMEMARGANRDQILTALEESQHPVMSLYARLERRLPSQQTNRRPGP